MKDTILILDFDSTVVRHEGLDLLAEAVLAHAADREERVAAIQEITNDGMLGRIGFKESLARRFAQLQPRRKHVKEVVETLRYGLSPTFVENKELIERHADNIYVVSGGFCDIIQPVLKPFGLGAGHVIANRFVWSGSNVIGYDTNNPLAADDGKIKAVQSLGFDRESCHIVMVGDGMTDFAVRKAGAADEFVAYTETARRKPVVAAADKAVASFDELFAYLGWD